MGFDKGKYDTKYNADNVVRKFLAFNKKDPEDMALLDYLKAMGKGKVNEYIKGLIRDDMNRKSADS